jgi:hypothetical protein
MSKADQEDNDPALGKFLSFLAQDIENNPTHILRVVRFPTSLRSRESELPNVIFKKVLAVRDNQFWHCAVYLREIFYTL